MYCGYCKIGRHADESSGLKGFAHMCAQFKKTEEDFEKMVEGKDVSGTAG